MRQAAADGRAGAIELTVVVPTFKERANVPLVVERLDTVLKGIVWEVVFVDDDSPDATAEAVRAIALRDPRVRIIQRIGRRGLSTACVEGVLSSSAPYFAVMDGDLQHDDTVLPEMFRRLRAEHLDIVVGSRYLDGERTEGLHNPLRKWLSRTGGQVARLILKADLTDPMSGFFVMARPAFDEAVRGLSQQGFKILLDLFASRRGRSALPRFRAGSTRACTARASSTPWRRGSSARWSSTSSSAVCCRFALSFFRLVGGSGVFVHLSVLWLVKELGFDFIISSAVAVVAAMTWNFVFNNIITYRDQRLRGPAFFGGLASFYAIGAIGALANVGIGQLLYDRGQSWWFAGIAGALIGVVWNYTMSSFFTWRSGGR